MKRYFYLQLRLFSRHLTDFGLPPLAGYPLIVLGFAVFSWYLFKRTDLAPYVYLFLAGSLPAALQDAERNNFLKICFNRRRFYQVRLLESTALALPFAAFLTWKGYWGEALALLGWAVTTVFITRGIRWRYALPTPFFRFPFEFPAGFRQTWWVFALAYFLTVMAVWVGNFNLGIFSILLVYALCAGFYGNLEPLYFVWIFKAEPNRFLQTKLRIATGYALIPVLPPAVLLIGVFPENAWYVAGFVALGMLYLWAFVLAKYAAFPQPTGLPQAFMLGFSIIFPPLVLLVLGLFYVRSLRYLRQFYA